MKKAITYFTVLSLLFLVGCSTKSADKIDGKEKKKLNAEELQVLIAGNTLHTEEYGEKADIEIYENGKLLGIRGPRDKNVGKWSIDAGGRLCIRFRKWGYGDEQCYEVHQIGDEYWQYNKSGLMTSRFTVSEGTSQGPPSGTSKTHRKTKQLITIEEPPQTAQTKTTTAKQSTKAIQEEPLVLPSSSPNAKKDLRLIYRNMVGNCPGCNLTTINLEGASIPGANLPGADLSGSNFSKVNLRRANLKGATLERTNLTDADLAGADLAGANLTGANLTGANLSRTNLKGANLDRVQGADLSKAIR